MGSVAELCMEQATCATAAAAAISAVIQWLCPHASLWSGKAVLLLGSPGSVAMGQRPCLVHVWLDVKLHTAIYLFSNKQDKMAVAAPHMTQAYALWQPTTSTCMCYSGQGSMGALHLASVYRMSPCHMIGWTVSKP